MARRCAVCSGSGKAMGGGCIMTTCDACIDGIVQDNGDKPDAVDKKVTIKIDKRSKQYKESVMNMCKETGCTEEKARTMIDAEMDKL